MIHHTKTDKYFLNEIQEFSPMPIAIIRRYGSRAHGYSLAASDYDIAICYESFMPEIFIESEKCQWWACGVNGLATTTEVGWLQSMELLFGTEKHLIHASQKGRWLIDHRMAFSSKKASGRMKLMMKRAAYLLWDDPEGKEVGSDIWYISDKRLEDISRERSEVGYSPKLLTLAVMVSLRGEALKTGVIDSFPHRDNLQNSRNGRLNVSAAKTLFERYQQLLADVDSDLPNEPDWEIVEKIRFGG